jgi:pyruvate-formate lyase-activating enzyme
MESKSELEFKQLVKIGVPENMAYLIVKHKYNNKEEVDSLIADVKDQQLEIQNELQNFVELSKNIEYIEKEKNNNLISNLNINDKN